MPYKIYALWSPPKPEDFEEFEKAYQVHAKLAAKLPGMRAFTTTRTSDGLDFDPNGPPTYRIAELEWDSPEALKECEQSPEWDALLADGAQMVERFGVTLGNAAGNPDRSWLG
jgi:uncharacterized protein (TIGR02118 family)